MGSDMPGKNTPRSSFKATINRQRVSPNPGDYSYPVLRKNLAAFRFFRRLVLERPGAKVLDIGCGFKPWQALFPEGAFEYTGVDADREASEADVAGRAEELPFGDSCFDAVICSEVLEHVWDLERALSEIRRVARDGALLYVTTPFMFPVHGLPDDYRRLTGRFYRRTFQADELLWLKESNSSAAMVFLSVNLFLESTPFSAFGLFKLPVYALFNAAALAADAATEALVALLGERFRQAFYLMPAGYSVVIRLKKDGQAQPGTASDSSFSQESR